MPQYRKETDPDGSTARRLKFAQGGLVLAYRRRPDDTRQFRLDVPGPSISLIVARIPPGGRVERHAHPEREAFLFSGPAVWVQDERMRIVKALGAALTGAGEPHSYCPLDTSRSAWMLALKFDPVAVETYLLARLAFAL